MDRRISRLLLTLALSLVLTAGGGQAQTGGGLGLGALDISFLGAGYFGYALPVANSALGREWARGSGLEWQVAYNSAVIPVRMDIEHRQARALRGRLEVSTTDGYAPEESSLRHETVVSREFLIPPSVPSSVMLLPRVCPVSEAGGLLKLTIRLYTGNSTTPQFEEDVEVLQLEPAHLYSLHLDGEPGIDPDLINADNHLDLASPPGSSGREFVYPPEMLESRHYTISCLHQQVTLAPLAARDFAFVFADARQARTWPDLEQQGLSQFVIGGGHLCLYNADRDWQGFDLEAGPVQAGRGVILPVAGDFNAARTAVMDWLEGELSEFVLWSGGTIAGWEPENLTGMENLTEQMRDMRRRTAPWSEPQGNLARQPGYLHPVWIYRETCRQAALEPWDYPEFMSAERDIYLNNRNLGPLDMGDRPFLSSFPNCVSETRTWPTELSWLLLILPLAVLGGGGFRRRWWLALALATAALGAGVWLWLGATPHVSPPLRAALVDLDQRCTAATVRLLQAAHPGHTGVVELDVPPGSSVRRVGGSYPVAWRMDNDNKAGHWRCDETGDFIALTVDAPLNGVEAPVRVQSRRLDDERIHLEVDTRGIVPGRECYLLHPLGWNVLPGGFEGISLELALPRIPVTPGRERLAALEARFDPPFSVNTAFQSAPGATQPDLLRYLAVRPGGHSGADPAELLCWLGLSLDPTGLRGIPGGQGIILAPLADPLPGREYGFVRLTFPLEGP